MHTSWPSFDPSYAEYSSDYQNTEFTQHVAVSDLDHFCARLLVEVSRQLRLENSDSGQATRLGRWALFLRDLTAIIARTFGSDPIDLNHRINQLPAINSVQHVDCNTSVASSSAVLGPLSLIQPHHVDPAFHGTFPGTSFPSDLDETGSLVDMIMLAPETWMEHDVEMPGHNIVLPPESTSQARHRSKRRRVRGTQTHKSPILDRLDGDLLYEDVSYDHEPSGQSTNQDILVMGFLRSRLSESERKMTICATIVQEIGRPKALCKLAAALKAIRSRTILPHVKQSLSIRETWQSLNAIDMVDSGGIYLRRLYLLRLLEHHTVTLQETQDRSRTLDVLAAEILSCSKAHRATLLQPRAQIQNKLFSARKWDRFRSLYSTVIVFLLPSGSEIAINSQDVEHLTERQMDAVLEAVQKFRGTYLTALCENLEDYVTAICQGELPDHLMKFETLDWSQHIDCNFNDQALLELCQIDPAAREVP